MYGRISRFPDMKGGTLNNSQHFRVDKKFATPCGETEFNLVYEETTLM